MNILVKVVLIGILGSQIACSDRRDIRPVFYGPDEVNITEGQALNMQLSAFDPEEQPLSFSISGGDDSYHFELTPSGVLNFVDPPDFDNPADADGDNRYQLSVTAFDGVNQSMQAIVITVDENLISTNDIEAQGVSAGGADDSTSVDDSASADDSASTDDTESMDASNDVDDSSNTVDSDSADDTNTTNDLVNAVAIVIIHENGSNGPFQESDTLKVEMENITAQEITGYRWFSDEDADAEYSTEQLYTLTQADVGKKLKVQVFYQDETGVGVIAESEETNIIRNINANVDLANLAEGVGFVINGANPEDYTGWSVSGIGDFNADGFSDVIVGAYGGDDDDHIAGNTEGAGASYVLYGSKTGSDINLKDINDGDVSKGFVSRGANVGDNSGFQVSGAGDVNADGYADIMIGAYKASPGGSTYLLTGTESASNVDLSEIEGNTNPKGFLIDRAGVFVSDAGDVNADGYADMAVGFFLSGSGASYILYGSMSMNRISLSDIDNNDNTKGFVIKGDAALNLHSTKAAGDINADGYDDVIIDAIVEDQQRAYIVSGNVSLENVSLGNIVNDSFFISTIINSDADLGELNSVGDVNGDGYDDLIIGFPHLDDGSRGSYVLFGPWDFEETVHLDLDSRDWKGLIISGGSASVLSGLSNSAGDFNGDGYNDLIIGAPDPSSTAETAGRSYIIYGKLADEVVEVALDAIDIASGFTIERSGHNLVGWSVDSAGDINGDGFDDVIIGGPHVGPNYTGASYVIYGGPTDYDALDKTLARTDEKSLVGSHGEDSLTWLEADAVLIGGAGDDNLIIGDENFVRIDGGNGVDTLTLASASAINLNFTAEKDQRGWHKNAITGIEVIDMAQDTNANTLTLSAIDVLNLSNTSYTLKVHTGANDTLELVDIVDVTSWETDGNSAIYTSTNNKATVEVTGSGTVIII